MTKIQSKAKERISERDMRMSRLLGNHYKKPEGFRPAEDVKETDADFIHHKNRLERVAEQKGLLFNPKRDKVMMLKKITAMGGKCLCRPSIDCPCPEMMNDIKKKGMCLCKLFVRDQE